MEEQFYLAWPLVIALGVIVGRRFALAAIVTAPLARFLLLRIWYQGARWSFPAVVDSLAAGCLLAMCQADLAKHRSFFTWRGFPLIWAFTLSIPVLIHYNYIFHFWHFAGLVQLGGLTVFNCGIALCIQNAITVRPRILNTPVCGVAGNHKLQFVSLANAVYKSERAFLGHIFSAKSHTCVPSG